MKMVPFVIPENLKVPDWFQNIFIHLQKEHRWHFMFSFPSCQRRSCFLTSMMSNKNRSWEQSWHIDASGVVWTLIDNGNLANQIVGFVPGLDVQRAHTPPLPPPTLEPPPLPSPFCIMMTAERLGSIVISVLYGGFHVICVVADL